MLRHLCRRIAVCAKRHPLSLLMVALVCLTAGCWLRAFDPSGLGGMGSLAPSLLSSLFSAGALNRRSRRHQPVNASGSYSRYSSELQDDTSIEIQQTRCRGSADGESKCIPAELEFHDKAVSGTKLRREGLDAMLAAAAAGQFNTLYFYSLSRLARESVIGMPILKRLVYKYKVRIVSVTEGVDSARSGWENLTQILLMQHKRYVKDLSESSFGGQKINIGNNFSNGDYCFGVTGEPVPGSENSRRGRHRRPRMRYKIDPVAAEWVKHTVDSVPEVQAFPW